MGTQSIDDMDETPIEESIIEKEYWGSLFPLQEHAKSDPIRLLQEVFTIGRVDCDHVFPDCSVISGKHCTITRNSDQTVQITDDSTNGTFLDGKKIGKNKSVALKSGMEITVCKENAKMKARQ